VGYRLERESINVKPIVYILFTVIAFLVFNCLSTFTAEAANKTNQSTDKNTIFADFSVKYEIDIDKDLNNTNPNIAKAVRQALFDYDCSNAKYFHYYGYHMDYIILIYDVKKIAVNKWGVSFKEKIHTAKGYEDTADKGSCYVTVTKQKSGMYTGYMFNPGGPAGSESETY